MTIFTRAFFIITLLTVYSTSINAQYTCDNGRFSGPVFDNVSTQSNIAYGSALSYSNVNQTLNLDFYEPSGDTLTQRPLLILAHGGSFIFGSKTDAYMVSMCTSLAKMGYAVASIQYRLGYNVFAIDSTQVLQACLRAVQDMKAAVRFFRKSYENGNPYRISNEYIFAGGVSAGAVAAVQLAYLDKENELPSVLNSAALGGLEGTSGNPGYSSKVAGIINLCGAVGRLAWIENEDVPIVSMHGTADDVVPYGTDFYYLATLPIVKLNGSGSMHGYMANKNMIHELKTWQSIGHTPFISNAAYMDSVLAFVPTFLANRIICNNLLNNEKIYSEPKISLFPNPASSVLTISGLNSSERFIIYSSNGQLVLSGIHNGTIDVSALPNGLYFYTSDFTRKSKGVRFVVNH